MHETKSGGGAEVAPPLFLWRHGWGESTRRDNRTKSASADSGSDAAAREPTSVGFP